MTFLVHDKQAKGRRKRITIFRSFPGVLKIHFLFSKLELIIHCEGYTVGKLIPKLHEPEEGITVARLLHNNNSET